MAVYRSALALAGVLTVTAVTATILKRGARPSGLMVGHHSGNVYNYDADAGASGTVALSWIVPHLHDADAGDQGHAAVRVHVQQTGYTIELWHAHASNASAAAGTRTLHGASRSDPTASTLVRYTKEELGLRPAQRYAWRVKVWTTKTTRGAKTVRESEWSTPSHLITTPSWGSRFAASTKAIWSPQHVHAASSSHARVIGPGAGAGSERYVLFRKSVPAPASSVKAATVYVTAAVEHGKQKLLGAYRLTINDAPVAIGPGRGECAHPAPTGAACTLYDTVDAMPAVNAAIARGDKAIVFGLQSYSSAGAVVMEAHLDSVVVGTDTTWQTHDATAYFNPGPKYTGGYAAPQENQNATAYPGKWQGAGCGPFGRRSCRGSGHACLALAGNAALLLHYQVPFFFCLSPGVFQCNSG